MTDRQNPRLIIVGAGFGGLWATRALADRPIDILLIDKNNYHTFLPLLYQVAAAELEPERIAQPVRNVLRPQKNVQFLMGQAEAIDFEAQTVTVHEKPYRYDYLLLAMGSTTAYFGVDGAAEHSFPLKSVEEGVALRNHILRCVERASHVEDAAERERLLTFVIVGGGPTGVEYAGALAELLHQPLNRDYPELNLVENAQVILIEMMDELLKGVGGHEYTAGRLRDMGVDVRMETTVAEVREDGVLLADDTFISTQTAMWSAGVRGQPLAEQAGLEMARGYRVPIRPTLQTAAHDNVFVVGDLAYLEEDGELLPGVAQVAMQQGEHAAENIGRLLRQQAPTAFSYTDKGAMATVGRNAAVANIGGRIWTGFFAWILWLVVHLFFLIGFRNRLGVLTNWAWNYIFYERVVRLILPTEAGPNEETSLPTAPAD